MSEVFSSADAFVRTMRKNNLLQEASLPAVGMRRSMLGWLRFQPVGQRRQRFPRLWLLLAALCPAVLGCERPFVEVATPDIEVISPDPGVVQANAEITLQVRASSFRAVERVELGGRPFLPSEGETWSMDVTLAPGLNRLVLQAFDSEDIAGVDTVHYLLLTPRAETAARRWEEARGAHAATVLPMGDIVITGGTRSTTEPASPQSLRYRIGPATRD